MEYLKIFFLGFIVMLGLWSAEYLLPKKEGIVKVLVCVVDDLGNIEKCNPLHNK